MGHRLTSGHYTTSSNDQGKHRLQNGFWNRSHRPTKDYSGPHRSHATDRSSIPLAGCFLHRPK
ncbi:hypothetical protein FOQG_19322 [Fusarium oxysporum f. sp. raphani 54005]|uniref:Uncharacterized protein n=1 Tax=Fusarium oxysporum f. sp. raphani 54005 TaxID=1089458 RepID=X0BAR0_FUSOX|nr:hypothetical protein FOQG_19322 [Fusarium oxysporum f. sp. raphani 54005]